MRHFSVILGSLLSLHLISAGQAGNSSSSVEQSNFITDFVTPKSKSSADQHTTPPNIKGKKSVKKKRTTLQVNGLQIKKNETSDHFVNETTELPSSSTPSTPFTRKLFLSTTPKLLDLIEAATLDPALKKQGKPVKRKDFLVREETEEEDDEEDSLKLLSHDDDSDSGHVKNRSNEEDAENDELETDSEDVDDQYKLPKRPKLPKLTKVEKKRIERRQKKRDLKAKRTKSSISNEQLGEGEPGQNKGGRTLWWQRPNLTTTTVSTVERTIKSDVSLSEPQQFQEDSLGQHEEPSESEQLQQESQKQNEEPSKPEDLQDESLGQNEEARTFWFENDNATDSHVNKTKLNVSSSERERKPKNMDERKILRGERDHNTKSNVDKAANGDKKSKSVFKEGYGWVDDPNKMEKLLEASGSLEEEGGNAKRSKMSRGFDREYDGRNKQGQGFRKDGQSNRGGGRTDRDDRQKTSKFQRNDRRYDNDRQRDSSYGGDNWRNERRPYERNNRNDRYRNDDRNGRYGNEGSRFERGRDNRGGGGGEYRESNYRRDDDRRGDRDHGGSQFRRDGGYRESNRRDSDRRGGDRRDGGEYRESNFRRDGGRGRGDRRDGNDYRESNFRRDGDGRRGNRRDSSEYRGSKPRRDDDRRNDGYRDSKHRGDNGGNNGEFDDRSSGRDRRPRKN